MANPEDQPKPADISAAADATPSDVPKTEPNAEAAASAPTPADEPITIEPRALILSDRAWSDGSGTRAADASAEAPSPRRFMPLAASLAIALTLGAIAGAAATISLTRDSAAPTASTATAEANRALRESQARLESELAALKTAIASGQRTASAQIGKLTERLDRAEKAQAEPAAKIAKVAESIDRLERRLPAAVAQAAPAAPVAGDITGSFAAKSEAKPPVAEGWHLLDAYAGRAVVESRNGRVFEVGPGSNLPGLGRVEAVKRENGRVVVVTRNGVIAALPDGRRTRFLYDN